LSSKNITGSLLVLAWPDTMVIKIGGWYDAPSKTLGIMKDDHYKAGHAASILVNHSTGELKYFDFGRYHSPIGKGRVRDSETDPDLTLDIIADIDSNNTILNIEEILITISKKKACHGKGRLLATVCSEVNYVDTLKKAKQMQNRDAIAYGPFAYKGTNCSRFVSQILIEGIQNKTTNLLLQLPYTLTSTPISNIRLANNFKGYYKVINGVVTKHNSFTNKEIK
jgi:hypothetical protein